MGAAADHQGCMQHVVHLHVINVCCLPADLRSTHITGSALGAESVVWAGMPHNLLV